MLFNNLDFIERGYNLCILGESDAGKSYLAIAIVNLPPRKMMDIDYEGMLIEYSCAVTPQIRQAGNRLSGFAETTYASLLA